VQQYAVVPPAQGIPNTNLKPNANSNLDATTTDPLFINVHMKDSYNSSTRSQISGTKYRKPNPNPNRKLLNTSRLL